MTVAYCYASGQIGFGPKCPCGALPIIQGGEREMEMVRGSARLAYDNETYLVPGVPEADNQSAGVDALVAFKARIEKRAHG